MIFEQFSNGLLEWIIRGAGVLWLFGAFMLLRQIRAEMTLDRLTTQLETRAREIEAEAGETPDPIPPRDPDETWIDRDDAARRGWIAAQAVVLAATSLAMITLHPFATWMAAVLVTGQGAYFFWREHTARHAPSPKAADHARPAKSTVNAGWVSLFVAILIWLAAFRGLLH